MLLHEWKLMFLFEGEPVSIICSSREHKLTKRFSRGLTYLLNLIFLVFILWQPGASSVWYHNHANWTI